MSAERINEPKDPSVLVEENEEGDQVDFNSLPPEIIKKFLAVINKVKNKKQAYDKRLEKRKAQNKVAKISRRKNRRRK